MKLIECRNCGVLIHCSGNCLALECPRCGNITMVGTTKEYNVETDADYRKLL